MPIHLDSVSRRRFFKGAAVIAVGGLGRPLHAATSSETWAFLSDTHIAADPEQTSRNVNMSEHLEKVAAELLEESEHLTGVIIDGDVALDDGQPGDYSQLKTLLKPLVDVNLPIYCTLGNHDDRVNFLAEYPEFDGASAVEEKHTSVIETEHVNLILADTLRFVDKVEGELGEAQLKWVSAYLKEHPDKPSIILGHHYPQVFRTDVIPSDEEIKISGLVDSEPFLNLINTQPAAKAYLYGHSHRWEVKSDDQDCHHINLPPTAYVFDEARPSGWVRATITHSGMKLELRSLDRDHKDHGQIHDLAWR